MSNHPLFNIDFEKEKKDEEYRQYRTKSNNAFHYPKDFKTPIKPWLKDKESKPPVISHNVGKISVSVMQERLALCNAEGNLYRRLAMFEKLKTQVERASVAYIDFMIQKTNNKMRE